MKIENAYQFKSMFPSKSQKPNEVSGNEIQENNIIATGTGILIRNKLTPKSVLAENRPDDPIVSKKILDSLDLGIINFSQKERDTLAKIMNNQN